MKNGVERLTKITRETIKYQLNSATAKKPQCDPKIEMLVNIKYRYLNWSTFLLQKILFLYMDTDILFINLSHRFVLVERDLVACICFSLCCECLK